MPHLTAAGRFSSGFACTAVPDRISPSATLYLRDAPGDRRPRHLGRSGSARRRRPRRLAAVRLPRVEPHRRRDRRRRPRRRAPGDAPVVLPHSRHRASRAASSTPSSATRSTTCPGPKSQVCGPRRARSRAARLLQGVRRVAMEYSPLVRDSRTSRAWTPAPSSSCVRWASRWSRPAISCSDSPTIWDEAALATHRRASEALYRIKDRAFDAIARRV